MSLSKKERERLEVYMVGLREMLLERGGSLTIGGYELPHHAFAIRWRIRDDQGLEFVLDDGIKKSIN